MSALGRFLERRNLENPRVPLTASSLVEYLDGAPSVSGVRVTNESALRHIAVFRCVELRSGTMAALPLKAYRKDSRERVVNAPVLDDPHPELTRFEVWEQVYAHIDLWGNAYLRKLRDGAGRVRYLWPIHPARVRVDLVDPDDRNPGGKVFAVTNAKGGQTPYTSFEILHLPGFGYDGRVGLSRIQLGSRAIELGLAAEDYAARFFGNGTSLSGILSTDQSLTQDSADRLKARWKEKVGGLSKAHDIAVLDNGAKFLPVSIPAKDAQLLETRQSSVGDIATLFGLPPHAIGDVERSTSWGTGIEQQTIGMVQFTFQPMLARVEQRLTKEVVQPMNPNVYVEYVVEGLLRGDAASRAAFYSQMRQMKAMSANEVRARENLEPYEGGDTYDNPAITVTEPAADDGELAPVMKLVDAADARALEFQVGAERRNEALIAAVARSKPQVTVNTPDVHVTVPPVNVTTPDVRVNVEPPQVTVEAPPAPNVSVDVHGARSRTLERDDAGNITRIIEDE